MVLAPGEVTVVNRDGGRFRAYLTGLHRYDYREHQYRVQIPNVKVSFVIVWIYEEELLDYCRTGRPIKLERCKNE